MDRINVFVDGAARNNGSENAIGAWAFVMDFNGKKSEVAKAIPKITNNQGEMMAIIMALKTLKILDCQDRMIEIFSDSAYCINGITDWVHGWIRKGWINSKKQPVENKELWQEMYNLRSEFTNLSFTKVKGHADNVGNNRADYLCNRAMDNLISGVEEK